MHTVKVATKAPKTTDRQGDPLTDKEGNPQSMVGVKLEGEEDKWFNIYGSQGGEHETIRKGMQIDGKIADNGRIYFLNSIPQASLNSPQPSGDDKMRSKEQCMRGEAIQAAAAKGVANTADLYTLAADIYKWVESGNSPPDDDIPF